MTIHALHRIFLYKTKQYNRSIVAFIYKALSLKKLRPGDLKENCLSAV